MKKHQFRTLFFKALNVLPSALGYAVYHFVQNGLTDSFEAKRKANERSFEKMATILKGQSFDLKDKVAFEIGSGWMPLMPYQLKVDGDCSIVHTFDINDHYSNKYIDVLNAHYLKNGRLNFELAPKGLHLPSFVKYSPNSNVIHADLPRDVNIIFSRFVLEHVTPEDLLAMHLKFKEEYGKDVLILHLISPSDHRAFSDTSLSHYDFLQYSEAEWNSIQTKFDYHNRLRLPHYLEIFEKANLEILHVEHDSAKEGTKKYDLFKKLKIHQDFAQFNDEELTAGSINVLLRPKGI